jgi:DNA-binding transcriptional MerR regulator
VNRNRGPYRIQQFAELAGVTVRALHHYDRLGLLEPRRTDNGYRVYEERDLVRLEQIVVLKLVGLSLKDIRALGRSDSNLEVALRRQQRVLAEKRRLIDLASAAIAAAEQSIDRTGEPDWVLIRRIIKEIEMQNNTDWATKYYTPGAREKVEARRAEWTPELQERVSRQWAELLTDVQAALGDDPASDRGQQLAARWRELVRGFTAGDPDVQHGVNAMWADQDNWPSGPREQYRIDPAIQEWIVKAMQAHA